jgi:RecB family exonuclease
MSSHPFADVTPGEPLVISATMYTTYLRCPGQALARLRGEYPAESRASFRGGLAHRLFARHLREGPVAAGDVSQACREEIGQALNPKVVDLNLRPSELRRLISEVGELYERFKRFPVDGFEAAEVFIEHEAASGITLRGAVDAVFGDPACGTTLIDWKTGGLGAADEQLAFYGMLWSLDRGELPGRVEAVSVASGERMESVPTEESVAATATAVAEVATSLRTALATGADLERRAGSWCRFCPILDGCSEGASAAAVFEGRAPRSS